MTNIWENGFVNKENNPIMGPKMKKRGREKRVRKKG